MFQSPSDSRLFHAADPEVGGQPVGCQGLRRVDEKVSKIFNLESFVRFGVIPFVLE